ncbi:MAG: glycosyltransferase family 2 protein, partial [Actinomycetota bacterium]|nr:glycosyltransferase family 2 protein [Actinomycetota bacterium]
LALGPAVATALVKRRSGPLLVGAAVAVGVAEKGRRRAGATAYFPPSTSLFAPLWLTERAITSWAALGARFFLGGVPYARTVLRKSATPVGELRSRFRNGEMRAL